MDDSFESLMQYTKEHFPVMGEAFDLSAEISEIEKEAREMPDGQERQSSFERLHYLDNKRFEKLAQFLTSYCKETPKQYIGIIDKANENSEKLKEILQQERQDNRQLFNNLCAAFVINPRKAFETVLAFIERDEKCNSADGYENWQWGLHFPLIARLRMAWKLIFGGKEVGAL